MTDWDQIIRNTLSKVSKDILQSLNKEKQQTSSVQSSSINNVSKRTQEAQKSIIFYQFQQHQRKKQQYNVQIKPKKKKYKAIGFDGSEKGRQNKKVENQIKQQKRGRVTDASEQQNFTFANIQERSSLESSKTSKHNIEESWVQDQPQKHNTQRRQEYVSKEANFYKYQRKQYHYQKNRTNTDFQQSDMRGYLGTNQTSENTQYEQFQYKNKCFKLIKNYQKLQQSSEQLQNQVRKIKKYFFRTKLVQNYKEKPKQVTLYKSLDHPLLFIGYVYGKEKRYMRLNQLQKSLKNIVGDLHQILKKIYDIHYVPVDMCWQDALFDFVKFKAKQVKVKLVTQKTFHQDQKQIQTLFYYCITKNNSIQLVYFDLNMNEITVGQQFIKKSKQQFKQSFQIFRNFAITLKNQDIQLVNVGQEQIQSQCEGNQVPQQIIQNLKQQIENVQKRLNQLLKKDINGLENKLQKKIEELSQITKYDYGNDQRATKLQDEIDNLNKNVDYFKDAREQTNAKLKEIPSKNDSHKFQTLKMCLKRMILAERHLQSKLPILSKKNQIFERLNKQNLIIIQGETGSGKSTQLPQLLCQYYKLFQDRQSKPVLITQPRKIATRSLAERVAEQMQEKTNSFVDYSASSTKIVNPKAKIVFMLDRLVLDQLIQSPTLEKYSCLVIDQAHERTISIDVILGLTKKLLSVRKDFKVIVTSASMEISRFQKYFNTKTLKVSGRLFPVKSIYYPSREQDVVVKIQKVILNQLLTQSRHLKDKYKGHILVFCADTSQISRLCQIFSQKLNPKLFSVLPLHGKLPTQNQKKVFLRTKQHKLIFASRIAETAITIDGVKVVIDPGFDRQMHYDQKSKFSSMKHTQISQSSAKQRAGRAGRTQQGFCFRLYTQQQFKNRVLNKRPEISNMALDALVLRLKSLKIDNVFEFQYIETPDKQGMHVSIQLLKMIGCLDAKQKITKIGQFLVKIPIEPFLARSIIQGLIMQKTISLYPKFRSKNRNITSSIIQILSLILNANYLFRIPQHNRQKGEFIKYEKFSHQKGDFFFLRNIYEQFLFQLNNGNLKRWLVDNFLNSKTLYQIRDLVKQISKIVQSFDIRSQQMAEQIQAFRNRLQYMHSQQDMILACLTTSFCTNLCLYSGNPNIGYTNMNQNKTLSIYGTSCLSLLGINPKWVLVYDLYEGKEGKLFCRIANQISFEFLRLTVNPYVYGKFRIGDAERNNPFYKQITYKLQTMLISKMKNLSLSRREYNSFQKYNFIMIEGQNKITAFIVCNKQNSQMKSDDQQNLDKFIQNQRQKAKSQYKHNYIGNIIVKLSDGFKIQQIQFSHNKTVFQITHMDDEVYHSFCNNWEGYGRVENMGRQKVKIFIVNVQLWVCLSVLCFLQYIVYMLMAFDHWRLDVNCVSLVNQIRKYFRGLNQRNINTFLSHKSRKLLYFTVQLNQITLVNFIQIEEINLNFWENLYFNAISIISAFLLCFCLFIKQYLQFKFLIFESIILKQFCQARVQCKPFYEVRCIQYVN